MSYLNRNAAALPEPVWERIDASALEAASEILTGRRFLDLDGPYGLGLTSLETGPEQRVEGDHDDLAATVGSRALPVPLLQRSFNLSQRRVEGHLSLGLPLDLRAVEDAAEAVARREEQVIYRGVPELGLEGLLTAKGGASTRCGDWTQVEQALDDVLTAVNQLDANGFGGPYALALSPARYNALFRRYQCGDMLQVDHLRRLCQAGLFKAAIDGAVLVDPRVGELKVGQDMRVGFASRDGIHLNLFVSESIAFLLDDPGAICTLEETA